MLNIRKMSKEEKVEYSIVAVIFIASIITGIIVGSNTNWFRPAFFSAGYMGASLLTCLCLFSIYRILNRILSFKKK